ncbi:OmpA family protein [Paracoccus chinensis]|uniref:Outer membrane protein OmpA n=1 Tax=Paracoccus chinensis TaxID=525640 RepID=A0A1G9DZR5_9RHOB|nr:OmpA family protein [Paracoccus chinensis]SDK69364.1 Outer membrane protein OmpA [Paracoccus chinensis]
MPRTFFRNSTALALGLGLALPHVSGAQALPAPDAARTAQTRAGNMPELARMLDEEIRAGLKADDLNCLMNAPKPCPEGSPLFTPKGIAVQMVEDGSFILAPAPQQVKRVNGEGRLVPADGKLYGAPRSEADLPAPVRLAQADGETATDAVPLPDAAAEGNAGADAAAADAAAAAAAAEADAPVVAEEPAAEAPAPEPVAEAAPEPEPEAAAPAEAPAAAEEPAAEAEEPAVEAAAPEETAEAAPEAAPEPAEAPVVEAEPAAEAPAQAAEAAAEDTAEDQPEAAAEPAEAPVVAAETPAQAAEEAAASPEAPTPAPQAQAAPETSEPAAAAEAPAAADAPSEADLARALAERSEGEASTDAAPAAESGAAASAASADRDAGAAPAAEATSPAEAAGQAAAESAATDGTATTPIVEGTASEGTAPAAEAAAGAGATAATAAEGAAPVVTEGAAATPTAPTDEELAAALAGAREVPEAEARPTDAAREAAAAAAAPAAAALAETAAPVTTSDTRQVTEETSRSATEDFLTDVRGALRQGDIPVVGGTQGATAPVVVGADGQPVTTDGARTEARDNEDDDRSNLENVLRQAVLPALAGLAVGQLLSNNRQVELNTGDRVVVTRPDGSQEIIKDDNALLLRPGSTVQTEEYADGSTRTIVTREDGSQVVTIRDADLRVLRRTLVQPNGTTTALIDETAQVAPVDVASLPPPARPVVVAPGQQLSEDALREALRRETQVDRTFTLGQIRNIPEVRALVAPVDIQAITFDTGSAAIKPDQAQALASLGRVIADSVRQNPSEMYLIEGHTDTVGADAMNLALSDRRAESVALALTEFFGVPPENMVVQGYGEQFLKVPQEGDIRANRRASVRRITDLLARS